MSLLQGPIRRVCAPFNRELLNFMPINDSRISGRTFFSIVVFEKTVKYSTSLNDISKK